MRTMKKRVHAHPKTSSFRRAVQVDGRPLALSPRPEAGRAPTTRPRDTDAKRERLPAAAADVDDQTLPTESSDLDGFK